LQHGEAGLLSFRHGNGLADVAFRFFQRVDGLGIATMDLISACCIASSSISHDRRHIEHFNVTRHPTSTWIVQ
jgi:hypothetical protein